MKWPSRQGRIPRYRRADHRKPRAEVGKAIPDDVLEELKACHVILKGPTTTPSCGRSVAQHRKRQRRHAQGAGSVCQCAAGQACPRKASIGPSSVKTPRGPTRSAPSGVNVSDDLAIDFTVSHHVRAPSASRALAYDYARKNNKGTASPSSPRPTSSRRPTANSCAFATRCRQGISRHCNRRLVHRHHHRQAHRQKALAPTSRCLCCPTFTATSSPTKRREFQGGVGTAGSAQPRQALRHV